VKRPLGSGTTFDVMLCHEAPRVEGPIPAPRTVQDALSVEGEEQLSGRPDAGPPAWDSDVIADWISDAPTTATCADGEEAGASPVQVPTTRTIKHAVTVAAR
jgi:hypothetical protein